MYVVLLLKGCVKSFWDVPLSLFIFVFIISFHVLLSCCKQVSGEKKGKKIEKRAAGKFQKKNFEKVCYFNMFF